MKKEYKKHKNETLAQWVDRIAAACHGRNFEGVQEMISDVSKTSYIEGANAQMELDKKYHR